jgi:putative ABC transport system ATP-binding protein
MNPMDYAVDIEQLTFSYRASKAVLRVDALAIAQGEKVFVYGPSGCGKTTLLGILTGVLKASAGRVTVLGRNFTEMSGSARDELRGGRIGYVFQIFNLIPYLNVIDNILLPCRISRARRKRLNGRDMKQEALALARQLGIAEIVGAAAVDLSVGQQQRVAVARALMGAPDLVIADEPTSALDEDHRERFLELLFRHCREIGSTLIFVSHDRRMMPLFDRAISLAEINRV